MTFLKSYITIGMIFLTVSLASADTPELVGILSQNLGVSEQQAAGGAGALFNVAQQSLSADEFSQVSSSIPGIDTMIGAAPAPAIGGDLLKSVGGVAGVANLASSFTQLGLKPDMVGQFTPLILDYAKQKGGEIVWELLSKSIL